jgi:fibronectin type 3 domain-containing protein
MKTIGTIALALTAALALSACDPYTAEKTGPGQVLSVFTSSQSIATVDGVQGPGGAWTVSGATSAAGAWPVVWVRFDKLLDGFSIQATPASCLPAASLGLNVTETTSGFNPTLPANLCGTADERAGLPQIWYACYVPNTAVTTEGAGVVFYQGCNDISSTGTGFNDNSIMQNGARYHITANVKDKQGRIYPLDLTVETLPGAHTLTKGATTATSQVLTWTAIQGDQTYDVQRAPDNGSNAAGTYATLAGAAGLIALTYTDATPVTGTKYWYRLVTHSANGLSRNSAGISNAPGATTLTIGTATATSVPLSWTAVTDAATYTVQRAPDAAGAAGTYADLAAGTGLTATTFTDATVATGTKYWYRIVSVGPNGVTTASTGKTVTTP